MNLEEHNQKTFEAVGWIVKLGFALFWGVIIGAMIAMWL
jgi:hypothetical protein